MEKNKKKNNMGFPLNMFPETPIKTGDETFRDPLANLPHLPCGDALPQPMAILWMVSKKKGPIPYAIMIYNVSTPYAKIEL